MQETQPCFTPGKFHRVSILQVAAPGHVFIFDLLRFPQAASLLMALLRDPAVLKLGQGFGSDLNCLHR